MVCVRLWGSATAELFAEEFGVITNIIPKLSNICSHLFSTIPYCTNLISRPILQNSSYRNNILKIYMKLKV